MSESKSIDRMTEKLRDNLRLQRIAARAARDAQHRADELCAISILVAAIQRPESAEHRDTLLTALGRMVDACLVNATIAKEGIEFACAGSLEYGGAADYAMLPDTNHARTLQH